MVETTLMLTMETTLFREKVAFAFKTMHVSPQSLAESGALCYDLEHIRNSVIRDQKII